MSRPYPIWLEGVREKRRTLKDIEGYLDPDDVYRLITKGPSWPYSRKEDWNRERADLLIVRDRALLAMLFLTGGRISEVLKVRKSQFSFGEFEDFVIIRDFRISKRTAKTLAREGTPMIEIPLPLTGSLAKFTELVLSYYDIAQEEMFPISRYRAHAIIKHITEKWCHYFRSQRLSHLVNLLRSALITSKLVGVKNPQTISHYYKTEWREHIDKLKQ